MFICIQSIWIKCLYKSVWTCSFLTLAMLYLEFQQVLTWFTTFFSDYTLVLQQVALKGQKEWSTNAIKMRWAGHIITKSHCGCSVKIRGACGYAENTAGQIHQHSNSLCHSRTAKVSSQYWVTNNTAMWTLSFVTTDEQLNQEIFKSVLDHPKLCTLRATTGWNLSYATCMLLHQQCAQCTWRLPNTSHFKTPCQLLIAEIFVS